MPGLGTVRMSRPELANVGGIVALSALGFLEWPWSSPPATCSRATAVERC